MRHILWKSVTIESVNAARHLGKKEKVLFIMGSTGSGKTKLSVDLATYFDGEIINSDKIQVYKGLDIITNKATESERRGIPHHMLGFIEDSEADFTPHDFCHQVQVAITEIISRNRIPIIAGGSNSYIEALVEDPMVGFRDKYECCFLWLDVSLPVLFHHVSKRVNQMVEAGVVHELEDMFVPHADYERGIRRAVGAPELDPYFRAKRNNSDLDEAAMQSLLKIGIQNTKENTCKLVQRQTQKIQCLKSKWDIHRLDATAVYEKSGEEAQVAWETLVLKPSLTIVGCFFKGDVY